MTSITTSNRGFQGGSSTSTASTVTVPFSATSGEDSGTSSQIADGMSVFIDGNAAITGTLYAAAVIADNSYLVSDRGTKEAVVPMTDNIVSRLQPVSYIKKRDRRATIGLVAQEVEALDPRLVNVDGKGGYSLDYRGVGIHMVHALQQLQKTQVAQQREIAQLRLERDQLRAKSDEPVERAAACKAARPAVPGFRRRSRRLAEIVCRSIKT
jgi:hypothetical protein